MGYKLAKSYPIPKKRGTKRKGHYPWKDMEVGHSFLTKDEKDSKRAKNAASSYARRHNMQFTWSDPDEYGRVRIWREK